MPIFDFTCTDCQKDFEEIALKDEVPPCPLCGGNNVKKIVSAPSPLKSGAFPFKVGPVSPLAKLPPRPSACPKGGG